LVVHLTIAFPHDRKYIRINPDKARLSVRRGQKATGLISEKKIAELPKNRPSASRLFYVKRERRR